jgi:hypothetical protein
MTRTGIATVWAAIMLSLAIVAAGTAASAEPTYEQWSAMGGKMYAAWRCAGLALAARMSDAEVARLFNKGLALGRPLVNAIFEGRVKPRNDLWIVPLGLLGCGQGPTAEFVLGRMYQCSIDGATRLMDMTETDLDKRAVWALRSYRDNKCDAD